jgi:hypothetical protein
MGKKLCELAYKYASYWYPAYNRPLQMSFSMLNTMSKRWINHISLFRKSADSTRNAAI